MAVAYHTHSFDVPEATDEQAAAGISREVFLVPANLPPLLAEKQGLNDALTSIAGLTTSADQMVYTTGADAYATTALTAYGRDIVGSIDASAVLTLLGAGTTGTALFQDETAADARTTLELGSLATLNTISNTNWSGADLAIENGGTGASSIEAARTNLGLGTAATADSTAFATSAQGLLADSAVQPGDGEAVPIGGTTGQVLAKASATDGDTFWTIAGQGDIISTNNGSDFADPAATLDNLGGLSKTGNLAGLADASIALGNLGTYADVATATSANVPASITVIRTQSYDRTVARGVGGAVYKEAADQAEYDSFPTLLKFTSNAGARLWVISEKIITPTMAGARGDDATDDGPALAACLLFLQSFGGVVDLQDKSYATAQALTVTNATRPYTIYGSGPRHAKIRRAADTFGTVLTLSGSDGWSVSNFWIDAGFSTLPTNASHAIAFFDASHVRLSRIHITDWKNSAILGYTSVVSNPPTHSDAVLYDCTCDGGGVSNNGLLLVNYAYSGMVNCKALNIGKGGDPCYCLQLKNGCQHSFIINGEGSGGRVGIAIGNNAESALDFAGWNSVVGGRIFDCDAGVALGETFDSVISGLLIDMNLAGNYGIDFGGNSRGWNITGTSVLRVGPGPSQYAVLFRGGDQDNHVELAQVSKPGGGIIAAFLSSALRNSVVVRRVSDPTTVSAGTSLVSNAGGPTNTFEYSAIPRRQEATITTGAVSVRDAKVSVLRVDTEAGVATDDLATINDGTDGQIITLYPASDLRDVVIKDSTGNIRLNGAADFTMTTVRNNLTLIYQSIISAWCEVSRGTAD